MERKIDQLEKQQNAIADAAKRVIIKTSSFFSLKIISFSSL